MCESVKQVFEKFNNAGFDSENHFKAKFLEVFEQDKMCGIHVFKASWVCVCVCVNGGGGGTCEKECMHQVEVIC